MKIIINADDLGINSTVNQEIESLLSTQKISSATIMANGKAFNDVKSIVEANPHASFGAHLVMDEFNSLTNNSILYKNGLINEYGSFIKGRIQKIKVNNSALRAAIYNELYLQVSKIVDSGIKVSHFDSHHHFHVNTSLTDIITELAKKFNINNIRRPFYFSPHYFLTVRKHKMKSAENELLKETDKIVEKSKFKNGLIIAENIYKNRTWLCKTKKYFYLTNEFHSYSAYYSYSKTVNKVFSIDHVIELMCHPGHPVYKEETKMVEDEILRNIMNYNLISYNDLPGKL